MLLLPCVFTDLSHLWITENGPRGWDLRRLYRIFYSVAWLGAQPWTTGACDFTTPRSHALVQVSTTYQKMSAKKGVPSMTTDNKNSSAKAAGSTPWPIP